ncbi:hypothetical protein [Ktedonospora formicarum]|nr:hypothetical protein [Ktedonospora formicarum]
MPISIHNIFIKCLRRIAPFGWHLLLLALTLLMFSSCSGETFTQTFSYDKTPDTFQKTFAIIGRTVLNIDSDAARIHIHRGTTQQVHIQGSKHTAYNDTIIVNYAQQGSIIHITSRINHIEKTNDFDANETSNGDSTYINFDITTPLATDTYIRNVAGTVDIADLSGQQDISTEGGSIDLQCTTLERSSHLETVAGMVTFDGSIAPQSENIFKTTAGSIDATLPSNAPVDVSISSMLGQVQNDFDAPSTSSFTASLHIENTTGSILVHTR